LTAGPLLVREPAVRFAVGTFCLASACVSDNASGFVALAMLQ